MKPFTAQPLKVSSLKAERGEWAARYNADTMILGWRVHNTFKFKDERFGHATIRNCENGFEVTITFPNEKGEPEAFPVYRWTKVKGRKPYTMVEIDERVLVTK